MELQREDREAETVSVTFGELAVSVGFEQQRQVGELRHGVLPSEGAVKEHMEWGGRQPFLATDDMADLHQMVINDVRQMVGRQIVRGLVKHLVIEDIGVDDNLSADEIMHMHILIRLHLEADNVFLSLVNERLYLVSRHCE